MGILLPLAVGFSPHTGDFATPSIIQDLSSSCVIRLRGVAQYFLPTIPGYTIIAHLPPQFRPSETRILRVTTEEPAGSVRINIYPNGDIETIIKDAIEWIS